MARSHDIGDQVGFRKGYVPTNATNSTTVTGDSIDRMTAGATQGHLSCVAVGQTGAASGSPSSYSVTFVIQHSDGGLPSSTDWTTLTTLTAATANNTLRTASINLETAKRYIRMQSVVSITGGSSPAVPISSGFVLGGSTLYGDNVLYSS